MCYYPQFIDLKLIFTEVKNQAQGHTVTKGLDPNCGQTLKPFSFL